jgi:hypothetical protein
MDTATEAQPNTKRTRFEETPTVIPSKPPTLKTSIERARFTANVTLVSLPNTIKPLAEHFLATFLKLRLEIRRFEHTKSKLAIDDYVPSSARIKFELGATERVKENASDAYTTLVNDTELTKHVFQNDLKRNLIKLADLEISELQKSVRNTFCEACGALSIAYAIHIPEFNKTLAHALVLAVMEKHHATLLLHSELDTPQDFFDTLATATNDHHPIHNFGAFPLTQQVDSETEMGEDPLTIVLTAIFVNSWTEYLRSENEKARILETKTFADSILKDNITAQVAMDLEDVTPSSSSIKELIATEIEKKTKHLKKQLADLHKNSKNSKGNQQDAPAKLDPKAAKAAKAAKAKSAKAAKATKTTKNDKAAAPPAAASVSATKATQRNNSRQRKNSTESPTQKRAASSRKGGRNKK